MDLVPHPDNFDRGDPYERYMGRWSRRIAPHFLEWLDQPPGGHWLDIGCGTGALCASIVDGCSPARVTGVEPSPGFRKTAGNLLADRATILEGNASALPLDDHVVDVTVSALVLNFVPGPDAALREMMRVTKPGGTIAACVWDYADGMQMIRTFWDAVLARSPEAAELDEANRFPLCHRGPLTELFANASLANVESGTLEIKTWFESFDDYWQPFLGGQGPAPSYLTSLAEPMRTRLRDDIRSRLPIGADGSIALTARAWMVRGIVPS